MKVYQVILCLVVCILYWADHFVCNVLQTKHSKLCKTLMDSVWSGLVWSVNVINVPQIYNRFGF